MLKVGKTMQAVVALLDDTPRTAREIAERIFENPTRANATNVQKACRKLTEYGYLLMEYVFNPANKGPKMVMAWAVRPQAQIPKCFYTSRGHAIGYAMVSILEALDAKGELTTRWVAENLYATDRVRMMALEDKALFFEAVAWAQAKLRRLEANGLIVAERSTDEYGRNKPTIWRRA